MAKQVIAYAAEDGTRFDTEAAAAEHDLVSFITRISSEDLAVSKIEFLLSHANDILPYLKAVVDGRARTLNPGAYIAPAAPVGAPAPSQNRPTMRTATSAPALGEPVGGMQRGGNTGWSVYEENGKWWCSNSSEKGGPFSKRGDAIAHFRAKEREAVVRV